MGFSRWEYWRVAIHFTRKPACNSPQAVQQTAPPIKKIKRYTRYFLKKKTEGPNE